jgi:thiamine biosynthesis protein ThiS
MKVQINGKPMDVAGGSTVKQILEQRGISPNVVACELNEKILKRATLGEIVLRDGDVLEIIQMIGGG